MLPAINRSWIWTVVSLLAFLPALFIAFEALATLSMSSRSTPSKVALLVVAVALPVTCLLGPAVAWNFDGKGNLRDARLARLSPLIATAALVCVMFLP
jgi:hypothetical protein